MKKDSKLSSVLHVLLHMRFHNHPLTSEELASYLDTNPVVVRRVLGGLRERGYIASDKGHGGGWKIACDFNKVTLRDIYEAVGAPSILAMSNRNDNPHCLVEQVVNASLEDAFQEAEALLMERLGNVTLAEISAEFDRKFSRHQGRKDHHEH